MKSSRIASIVFVAIVAILMLGCTDSETERVLDRADSLMDICPDSIYQLLDSVCRNNADAPKPIRMRAELLKAKAQNKAYVDFTTDSVMLEVADYYDHHGSANDRMLAHYLLGCTYRDLKEAPMTLQCYYDAVEAADTTSSDCDYRTMMSIYGQIATILDKQYMPMEELDAWNNYQKYALLSEDTLNYIRGMELRIKAFNLMCNTEDSILKITEETHRQYSKYGYDKEAASVYLSAISVYLDRQDYAKAHELMCIFENESGLFDEKGNIKIGREYYYTLKGRYYYGIHNLDSAQSFFRKRLVFNKISVDTYAYMLHLYAQNGNTDSLLEYTEKLCVAFNQLQTDMHTEAMHQAKGMYDYTRNQKIAMKKSEEVHKKHQLIVIMGILFFLIISAIIALYLYNKKQKKHEMTQLNLRYINALEKLRKVQNDLTNLGVEYSDLRVEKEQDIHILQERINMYKAKYGRLEEQDKIEVLRQVPIVSNLSNNLKPGKPHVSVTEKDWQELYVVFKEVLPSFYSTVICGSLTHQETQVAVLTKLEYNINEIAILLSTSPQRITNARASANKKLFGDNSAKTFTNNLSNL